MQLLKVIRDSDVGLDFSTPQVYEERVAGRAVVLDKGHRVALLHAANKNYHKLPGGGVEKGEDIITATKREAVEEIGCEIDITNEIGIVEEYRNEFSLHQLSHCYIAKVVGEKKSPNYEEGEKADGFEPVWIPIDEAIKIMEGESAVEDHHGKFIQIRDLLFLQEAKRIIG